VARPSTEPRAGADSPVASELDADGRLGKDGVLGKDDELENDDGPEKDDGPGRTGGAGADHWNEDPEDPPGVEGRPEGNDRLGAVGNPRRCTAVLAEAGVGRSNTTEPSLCR
jgi:hypothetical protein